MLTHVMTALIGAAVVAVVVAATLERPRGRRRGDGSKATFAGRAPDPDGSSLAASGPAASSIAPWLERRDRLVLLRAELERDRIEGRIPAEERVPLRSLVDEDIAEAEGVVDHLRRERFRRLLRGPPAARSAPGTREQIEAQARATASRAGRPPAPA